MSALRLLGWLVLAAIGPMIAWLTTSALAQSLIAQATFAAMFALGIGFLLRQNGMVSFGHAAFFGLPGYMLGALLPLNLMPIEPLICLTVVAIGVMAFVIGLVIVRAHGIAFGMLTLAVGQAVYEAATRLRGVTGGSDGMNLRLPKEIFGLPLKMLQGPAEMLTISWLVMVAVLVIVSIVAASRFGILTEAIRDNEERARFLGYRTLVPRAAVFALSAAVTAGTKQTPPSAA